MPASLPIPMSRRCGSRLLDSKLLPAPPAPPPTLALRQGHLYPTCRSRRGDGMSDPKIELPQGTLDLLILKTLALSAQHGWAISERLQQISRDALQVRQGSLYPALHRLERRGWIRARWGESENTRRAKYYELTDAGRKQLAAEESAWKQLTAAVGLVLEAG